MCSRISPSLFNQVLSNTSTSNHDLCSFWTIFSQQIGTLMFNANITSNRPESDSVHDHHHILSHQHQHQHNGHNSHQSGHHSTPSPLSDSLVTTSMVTDNSTKASSLKSLSAISSSISNCLYVRSYVVYTLFLHLLLVSAVFGQVRPNAAFTKYYQINLIQELNLHNFSYSGLSIDSRHSQIQDSIHLFEDSSRKVRLNPLVSQKAGRLILQSHDITFVATIKQKQQNTGAIFAFTDGIHRVLEIQSSGRRKELRFHYRHQDAVFAESFDIDLADDTWHKIALTVSSVQIDLYVDCVHRARRQIQPIDTDIFRKPSVALWLGQRGLNHFMFQGYLKDVRIISSANGFRAQCPDLETACPTCGQFKTLVDSYAQLENKVKDLTEMLHKMEQRMANVESCECAKSCKVNGTSYDDGSSWRQNCDLCTCSAGKVTCLRIKCDDPCKNPQQQDECCPKCKKQCLYKSMTLNDGERFAHMGSKCVQCVCNNGKLNCHPFQMSKCPKLNCPPSKHIQPQDQCCMICEGTDFCSQGHSCHKNAECRNLRANYTCVCHSGYRGNGHTCEDIDECADNTDKCVNAVCVNKPGSYQCRCKSGYSPIDRYNCMDIDECSTKQHLCDENALCTNTPGFYQCKCKQGYQGDGQSCKPVCKHSCLNGGQCVGPNTCSCRKGYYGHQCEADIDECALGLHHCPSTSKCINKPGWYHCVCNQGYSTKRELIDANSFDHQCQDIDECSNPLLNTCPASTRCVNLDGTYRCDCNSSNISNNKSDEEYLQICSLSCIINGIERNNNERWSLSSAEPCTICQCLHGVVTCKPKTCDCSDDVDSNSICCPQCNQKNNKVCYHQEDKNRMFKSGQQWTHDCQTCECLNGEIDCWNECPPVNCINPIRTEGDCCLRCEDDPCQWSPGSHPNSSLVGCHHMDKYYRSGQVIKLDEDRCASCLCNNGRLCCTYTTTCKPLADQSLPVNTSAHHFANQILHEDSQPFSTIGRYMTNVFGKTSINNHHIDEEEHDRINFVDEQMNKEFPDNGGSGSLDFEKRLNAELNSSSSSSDSVNDKKENNKKDEMSFDWSHEMAAG